MSTKTNFKRVALVAVAALGLGVLTSVAPASAAGVDITDIVIAPAGAGTLGAIGVCVVDPNAQDGARTQFSTATVVAKGAVLTFQSTLVADATLTISGPAKWTGVSETVPGTPDLTFNTTASKLTVVTEGAAANLTTTGVGTVTVTATTVAGVGIDVIGITVVDSCSTTGVLAPANTLVNLAHTATDATGTDVLAAADKAYGQNVFINLNLKDAYKGAVTNGVLTATATNGALISFAPLTKGVASQAFVVGGAAGISLRVNQDIVTNPGKALTSVVTIAFNGATVATKTVTIFGQASSIEISKVTVGTSTVDGYGIGTFAYVTKDNAGNLVNSPAAPDISAADAGIVDGAIVSGATALTVFSAGAPTTLGTGTFKCAQASTTSSGTEETGVGFVTAALTVVKATFKATCGSATVSTFTAGLDKAVYQSGEIATLTITGKDANGGMVSDAAVTGISPVTNVALSGLTPIGAVATDADHYLSGVLTYKFKVDNITSNEQSFVGQVKVTAAKDLTPKILQYKVVAGGTGVSNADVLKAIVSLIASINKQIAALQKALLKKK